MRTLGVTGSRRVLRGLMKRVPPRLFVGNLSVASGNLVRHLEGLVGTPPPALDRALLVELSELLPLPKADTVEAPLPTDMAFDVALQDYRSGSATDLALGAVDLPMYWRPRIRLAARLYRLRSKEPKATFHVTQRMPWIVYLNRVLSWRVLVGMEHPARRSDLNQLLRQATERLLTRVRDSA
jgi:hypothetical protein